MSVVPISPVATTSSAVGQGSASAAPQSKGFDNVFSKLIQSTNQQQLASDQAIRDLASGQNESVHNVVLSAAKADLSFRLVLEIRNRLVDAYQEIMRMQV